MGGWVNGANYKLAPAGEVIAEWLVDKWPLYGDLLSDGDGSEQSNIPSSN